MIASVGKYTYGNENIKLHVYGTNDRVYIGSFCSIATGMKIFLGENHRTDFITTYPFGHINKHVFNACSGLGHPCSNGDVVIGNDVWIGACVTIMSGVKIGDGAVIAANSHVFKNVEPYSIYGGNPCKFIKLRFPEEQIKELLKIKWWEWEDSKINNNAQLLASTNLTDFIRLHAIV